MCRCTRYVVLNGFVQLWSQICAVLKRAERVAQANAPGSCKLQCPLAIAGDVISGHNEINNARWWRHQRSPAGIAVCINLYIMLILSQQKSSFQLHMQHRVLGRRETVAGYAVLKIPLKMYRLNVWMNSFLFGVQVYRTDWRSLVTPSGSIVTSLNFNGQCAQRRPSPKQYYDWNQFVLTL